VYPFTLRVTGILITGRRKTFRPSETLPSACYILSDESSIPFYSTSNITYFPTNLVYPFTLRVTCILITGRRKPFRPSETLPSACYILSDESSIPCYSTSNGYTYNRQKEAFPTVRTLPSACYILSDESSIPLYSTSNGYTYNRQKEAFPAVRNASFCLLHTFRRI